MSARRSNLVELPGGQEPQLPSALAPDGASLRELAMRALSVFLRHRWWAFATFLATVAAGIAVTALQTRLYSASTRILVHPSAPRVLDKVNEVQEEFSVRGWGGLEQFNNTQQDIITGRSVAERVVERLALDHDESFVGALSDPDTQLPYPPEVLRRRAVNRLRDDTTLVPSPRSQTFDIVVTDRDPQRAADLSNALAEAYRDFVVYLRVDLTRTTSTWLEEQVAKQRNELEASEQAIQDFVGKHGLQSLTIGEWRNVMAEKVTELTRALATAEQSRIAAEAEAASFARWTAEGRDPAAHPSLAADPLIREMTTAIVALDRNIERMRERYGEKWEQLKQDEQEVALLRSRRQDEVAARAQAVEDSYQRAKEEERLLQERIDGASSRATEFGGLEVEYNRLRRIADTNAQLYETVLRRAKETQLARNLEASNVNILDRAVVPQSPTFPRIPLNAAATLLAAVVLAMGCALLFESFDNTIRDVSELESDFKVWPLGVLPIVGTTGEREIISDLKPKSAAAECLRSVRTNLLFLGTKRPMRRLLVTSASPRDGKTTLCSNIAATMALAGHRVLLVDTDMRRPQIHKIVELPNDHGIVDVFLGDATPQEVIQKTRVPGLDVLLCGRPPHNPAELLSSRAFDALLDRLSADYDYVLLDSPPALVVTDASILAQKCDGTLLVLRIGQTERRHFRDTMKVLDSVHANVIGVVANAVDSRRSAYRYGYDYRYGYYRTYGEDENPERKPTDETDEGV